MAVVQLLWLKFINFNSHNIIRLAALYQIILYYFTSFRIFHIVNHTGVFDYLSTKVYIMVCVGGLRALWLAALSLIACSYHTSLHEQATCRLHRHNRCRWRRRKYRCTGAAAGADCVSAVHMCKAHAPKVALSAQVAAICCLHVHYLCLLY
jgi:hypothetical protein